MVKVDRGERRIGLSIKAVNMTEDQVKELEAEAAGTTSVGSTSSTPVDGPALGSLGAAFDDAFGNVEWQPGEAETK